MLDRELDQPLDPFLVIAHAQILGGLNELALVTGSVYIPFAPSPHGEREREGPRLPARMEHRLVFLIHDAAHAVHAAHIVDAVHGSVTLATPTMASRVTSAASSSSRNDSLPAGRSGSTRYRSSAVLSHTRTSTSGGRLSPNSRSTP